jgi:hypothetical protein
MIQDNRLQLAIHQLIMPPVKAAPAAPAQPESGQSELPAAQSEVRSNVDGLPESTERLISEMRERSRRQFSY